MKIQRSGLKIYQSVVIIMVAVAIAVTPSLLIWKYHVMSLADPSVVIGLAVCYVFAVCAIIFGVRYLCSSH